MADGELKIKNDSTEPYSFPDTIEEFVKLYDISSIMRKIPKPVFKIKARSANELIGDLEWCAKQAASFAKELSALKEEEAWAYSGNLKELAKRMRFYAKQIKKQAKP